MRILIDTNIALSALLSPNGRTANVLKFVLRDEHTILQPNSWRFTGKLPVDSLRFK